MAVDDQRIDNVSAVVGHRVTQELNRAGERIDFDLRHMRPVAIRSLRRSEIGRALDAGRLSRSKGKAGRALRRPRKLPERERRLVAGAGDRAAILDIDVVLGHAQNAGGERDDLLAHAGTRNQRG